ncbi:hypothetical protein BGX28_010539, partial [Mortierella sp. GBA30]
PTTTDSLTERDDVPDSDSEVEEEPAEVAVPDGRAKYLPPGMTEESIPEAQWKRFFSRLHYPQRRTNEKDFLYLFAHHAIQTNAIKSFYKYEERESGCCRGCLNDHPTAPPVFETHP